MAAAGGRATNTAVKLAFEPPVQRLVGRRGRVSAELVYSEQSCFAYNQGGSRRATTQAGKRRREVAPKYIKIPQVSCRCHRDRRTCGKRDKKRDENRMG